MEENKVNVSTDNKQDGVENASNNDAKATPSFDMQLETTKINERLDILTKRLTSLESVKNEPIQENETKKDFKW